MRGFTLVELLVVITIIVMLLALVVPAMERAIYQAEAAACAAHLDAVATGAISYAALQRRWYPYRAAVHDPQMKRLRMRDLTLPVTVHPHSNPDGHDERPTLAPYMPIRSLACPLPDAVDLESPEASETRVYASYQMWFGWRYDVAGATGGEDPVPERGMFKLGDQWQWKDNRFSAMAGDHLSSVPWVGVVESSHPDGGGFLQVSTFNDKESGLGRETKSEYIESRFNGLPGSFDLNFAFDDGSVQLARGINWDLKDNPEFAYVPMLIEEDIEADQNVGRSVAPRR